MNPCAQIRWLIHMHRGFALRVRAVPLGGSRAGAGVEPRKARQSSAELETRGFASLRHPSRLRAKIADTCVAGDARCYGSVKEAQWSDKSFFVRVFRASTLHRRPLGALRYQGSKNKVGFGARNCVRAKFWQSLTSLQISRGWKIFLAFPRGLAKRS